MIRQRRVSMVSAGLLGFLVVPAVFAATESPVPPSEEMLKLRDPFKRPEASEISVEKRTELESFAVDALKMVGTISGPDKVKAMLIAPDGRTYFVSVNTKVGLRGGFVRKIEPGGVHIREKVVNVLGQEEDLDTILKLGDDKNREHK